MIDPQISETEKQSLPWEGERRETLLSNLTQMVGSHWKSPLARSKERGKPTVRDLWWSPCGPGTYGDKHRTKLRPRGRPNAAQLCHPPAGQASAPSLNSLSLFSYAQNGAVPTSPGCCPNQIRKEFEVCSSVHGVSNLVPH